MKGHRDGLAAFPFHSSQLLDEKHYPLPGCYEIERSSQALSQYLGIREWLERIATKGDLGKLTNVDKPTFSTQIIIKYDGGNAGPSYFIPNGHVYSATLFGSRTRDETLTIAFTPDSPTSRTP
jgi:hypothetical protein